MENMEDFTNANFIIMNVSVSALVFMSAYYADFFIRGSREVKLKNVIHVPDSVLPSHENNENIPCDETIFGCLKQRRYLSYFAYNIIYFVLMFYSVVGMKKYPGVMVIIQHIAIVSIISLYFLQFVRPTIAVPISIAYATVWFLSGHTQYRWLVNNTIVIMSVLLTGYIQFKNFMYLQIFMWLAFVYDVYLLAGLKFFGAGSELFSIDQKSDVNIQGVTTTCQTLLCSLFTHNSNYELPTVFSIQLGRSENFVYIGTGDIIIGAFAANFTLLFFKNIKYLIFTVATFGLSIAMLSQVAETPFPALLSIVPLCTVGLLLSGLASKRSVEMLLDNCSSSKDKIIHPSVHQLV